MKAKKVTNLLRPGQVDDLKEEERNLERTVASTDARVDKGTAANQLRRLKKQLHDQSPTTYKADEVDAAVARGEALKEAILVGMPTQAEMSKAPSGAVGKHLAWEKANKARLQEYKYIQLRLNAGTDDPDVANFEKFRPRGGSGELNMHNTIMPSGQTIHLPPGGIEIKNIMPEEEAVEAKAEAVAIQTAVDAKRKSGIGYTT